MVLIEVNGEQMEQCENCGRIWDGNAQCNCLVDLFEDADDAEGAGAGADDAFVPMLDSSDDESGYEST